MDHFLEFLTKLVPLFELLLLIFWSVFLILTYKTFRQIKQQTDLQSEAFLVVASKIEVGLEDSRNIPEDAKNLHQKWYDILKSHLPNALQSERYIILELKNRGKSDIVYWIIKVMVDVSAGEYLYETFNTSGENESWEIKYLDHNHIIAPGESIEVPIAMFGPFPIAEFTWNITYRDIRDKVYDRFGGDFYRTETNVFANPSLKDKKPQ